MNYFMITTRLQSAWEYKIGAFSPNILCTTLLHCHKVIWHGTEMQRAMRVFFWGGEGGSPQRYATLRSFDASTTNTINSLSSTKSGNNFQSPVFDVAYHSVLFRSRLPAAIEIPLAISSKFESNPSSWEYCLLRRNENSSKFDTLNRLTNPLKGRLIFSNPFCIVFFNLAPGLVAAPGIRKVYSCAWCWRIERFLTQGDLVKIFHFSFFGLHHW